MSLDLREQIGTSTRDAFNKSAGPDASFSRTDEVEVDDSHIGGFRPGPFMDVGDVRSDTQSLVRMHISTHRCQSGCFGVIQENPLLDYSLGLGYTTRYIRPSISGIIRVMFIPPDRIRVLCCVFSGAHLPRS